MPFKPRNSHNWYASFRDAAGRRVRRSTGTPDYRQATALEGQWRAEVWRQTHWGERPRYRFEDLIEGYLDATEARSANERSVYAAKALARQFEHQVVAEITPAQIADYKRARLAEVAVATVIKELGVFSAAINHANAEWGWQLPNVVAGRIPNAPPGRLRWLTRDEQARLIAQARRPGSAPYLADLIVLALHTGLRHRELLGLTWDRVDWRQRLIYFAPGDHKSERFAAVPVNHSAYHALARRWHARAPVYQSRRGVAVAADTAHVFTYRGRAIASAKKSFARQCANAGIADATLHDLRHTFASMLVQAGQPLAAVKDVMRHRSIQTTMRYAHLAPENTRAAVAALDD